MTGPAMAPYRDRAVNSRAMAVADELFDWSMRHCTCRRGPVHHARLAHLTATYCAYCDPEGVTPGESLAAGQCVLLLFFAEDGSPAEMEGLAQHLSTGAAGTGNEVIACYTAMIERLRASGCATAGLEAVCRDWAANARAERHLDTAALTVRRYLPYREQNIYVHAYDACWTALRHLTLSPTGERALRASGLLTLATRSIIIANDLASLERDSRPRQEGTHPVDINTVLMRARALGSRDAAIREAVARYNRNAAAFPIRARRFLNRTGDGPGPAGRVANLRSQMNGNLAAVRHLIAERYRGAARLFGQLNDVGDL
jgi:hypothetical protein